MQIHALGIMGLGVLGIVVAALAVAATKGRVGGRQPPANPCPMCLGGESELGVLKSMPFDSGLDRVKW